MKAADGDVQLRQRKPDESEEHSQQDGGKEEGAKGGDVALLKTVGLIGGISMIVGTMIGSGIFISPKGVTRGSGSVALSLISWAVCGLIATGGSLTLAELGTMITKSGGEYVYLGEAFGSIPAFLFAWVSVLLLRPAGVAIICLTCAEYALIPFFEDGCGLPPELIRKLVAAVVMLMIAGVNCYSVTLANRVQIVFTFAKIMALILIIIGGIVRLFQGYTEHLATGFDNTNPDVGAIALGFYQGMWAYDGWNNLNYVTEEMINPERNLPLSIIIGIPMVTILYILTNVSYFTVMSVTDLLESSAVATTWADAVIQPVRWIIPISVALSTFGAANGTLLAGGRLTYVAAREGHMVEAMSMINVKRYTPLPSMVLTSIIACIMIVPSDIESLIDFFNFAVWFFYGGTMLACIVMRWTRKDWERPYKVPIIVPIFVFLCSIFLVVAPIVSEPRIEFLYAALFIVAGLIFYVPFVHYKLYPPFMSQLNIGLQLFFESSPATSEPDA